MEKRILFLQPDHLVCYARNDSDYIVEQKWNLSGNDLPESLAAYIQAHLHTEFSLVFDIPEEECFHEPLKAKGIFDRRKLADRLKNKRFESSLVSKATIVGSRSHSTLLLSGLDSNALFEKLVSEFARIGASLRAIHSSTTLIPNLASMADAEMGPNLFIIPLHGCFRLLACTGASVLFSRRVSVPDGHDTQSVEHKISVLQKSIEETLLYMQRQHREWVPSVVMVARSEDVERLVSIHNAGVMSSQLAEFRSYWPFTSKSTSNTAESLLVGLAVNGNSGYAQKSHRVIYINRKIRNICAALALGVFSGAVSSIAVANKINGAQSEVADAYSEILSTLQRDVTQYESSYEQPVEAVRQALVAARLLELNSAQEPLEFLQNIAPSMSQLPDISISSVRWQTGDHVSEKVLANVLAQPDSLHGVPMEEIFSATLAGVVTGQPESALNQFESFIDVLRTANSDPLIVVVETPFGSGDQSRITASDNTAPQSEFVLEISKGGVEQ